MYGCLSVNWNCAAKIWEADISDNKPKTPPQLLVDNFSFEELHSVIKRNGNQTLGLFDEMSSFYAQLDLFKHTGLVFINWKNLIYFRRLSIYVHMLHIHILADFFFQYF